MAADRVTLKPLNPNWLDDLTKMQSTLPSGAPSQSFFPLPVHKERDDKGTCITCGAASEDIDDNLVRICVAIDGPNRLAIIAARHEHYRCQWSVRSNRSGIGDCRVI